MSTDAPVIEKKKVTSRLVKEPNKFKVIVCNDDVTPVDFVIAMLVSVFRHDEKTAMKLTLDIHHKGSAVVGLYSYEIAEQKAVDGVNLARAHGYPLIIKIEEE